MNSSAIGKICSGQVMKVWSFLFEILYHLYILIKAKVKFMNLPTLPHPGILVRVRKLGKLIKINQVTKPSSAIRRLNVYSFITNHSYHKDVSRSFQSECCVPTGLPGVICTKVVTAVTNILVPWKVSWLSKDSCPHNETHPVFYTTNFRESNLSQILNHIWIWSVRWR